MRIIDISRELSSCPPAPGFPEPVLEKKLEMKSGAPYNYTYVHACVHAATHCDAALHFVADGQDIALSPLEHFIGMCYVHTVTPGRLVLPEDLQGIPQDAKRVLLHGNGTACLSQEAALFLKERGVCTVGTDAFSVGAPENDREVHLLLLSQGISIIENLKLDAVADGTYFLSAAPCKFDGAEAAFCRAVLISDM